MKAVILAGGLGTRIGEDTEHKPKPMIEIGGMPILVHIMRHYARFGVNEFIVCCGYKGYVIKEYFANYMLHRSDFSIDMARDEITVHKRNVDQWKVTLVDTGQNSQTGGRLRRVKEFVQDEKCFHFTYGDGLSDVDIAKLTEFHIGHGRNATVTSVRPPGRFGALVQKDGRVTAFEEKPIGDGGRINGGFFILNPAVIDLIESDETVWERNPMVDLANTGELMAYNHEGFWQPMDTLRDKKYLIECWDSGDAPWARGFSNV